MKFYLVLAGLMFFSSCAKSQNNKIGGPCEGCEAIYEYGNRYLNAIDTLPGFNTMKVKIKLSGTVFMQDGKTPAKNVILYAYQTNDDGRYPSKSTSKGWEKRHGYLRGWVKTNSKGHYTFYTSRPASYPNSTIPQHIHITVKEPGKNEYYIEDVYFSDDPYLTLNIKNRARPRAGSGVITLTKNDPIKEATRDIILGLNIPNY